MVNKKFTLDRGDIVWVDFNPTKGHEQSGVRPAVVVSPLKYNAISTMVLACPITKKHKGYFFEVPINELPEKSFALVDQPRSVDSKVRIKRHTGRVSDDEMYEILARIAILLQ